jgi:hypothetical protein
VRSHGRMPSIRFHWAVGSSRCTSRWIGRAVRAALLAAAVGSGCAQLPPIQAPPPVAASAPAPYQARILAEAMRRLAAMGKDPSGFRVIIAERLRRGDAEVLAEKGITDGDGIWRVSFVPDVAWSTLPVPTQTELGAETTFYFREPSTESFAVWDEGDDE